MFLLIGAFLAPSTFRNSPAYIRPTASPAENQSPSLTTKNYKIWKLPYTIIGQNLQAFVCVPISLHKFDKILCFSTQLPLFCVLAHRNTLGYTAMGTTICPFFRSSQSQNLRPHVLSVFVRPTRNLSNRIANATRQQATGCDGKSPKSKLHTRINLKSNVSQADAGTEKNSKPEPRTPPTAEP
ncbi:MAG: hypothetical protein K2M95_07855 [Clostridiales bacterium]|nr:hypothetical protein [Clostridiales bacterium]